MTDSEDHASRRGRPDTVKPVTELGDGVYDLTLTVEPARYRAYLFDWDRPTLVDCGLPETSETLIDRIERVGIEPERLIVTHAHPDHDGGFDAVVDRYDTTTWVPEESTLAADNDPDHRYSHDDTVGPFTAVHVPGHSVDNYALVAPDRDLAVMGDAVLGADWRGLPAGYFVLVEGIYSDDLVAAERNLERLQQYAFDVGLVFHGSSVFEDARGKLDDFVDFPNKGDWDDPD
ncbi:MBL fold metallo-hydrolase [Haloarcula sp. S1CR25-12]|uniref:MBL fold metallo-hydrolase n=1 Tax=Haloarcula saliterrae TaxID=2950534 RepID=A0ABU2FFS1_9EURY|nr:MBL fold metallo-hydrolase [Haloarcula sp. S1CR25-12]MDS0261082.1 MBL fold metallo-hydrolase [Haloarcula sp. S1CR25-12]